jgi:hypothetical protein
VATLNTDQSRAVAGLLREYGKLLCELNAAKALLAYSANDKLYPKEWKQALEDIKQKPGYADPAKGLELIAAHLEKSASEVDLTELLSKIPKGIAPN